MKAWLEFLNRQQNVFGKAALLATVLVVVMWVRARLSFGTYKDVSKHVVCEPVRAIGPIQISRIARFVDKTAQLVPEASCLTQALAAQLLLARCGVTTLIHIGVNKDGNDMAAHAWLKLGEGILLGGTPDSIAAYTPLTTLAPRAL
jgi:Transglutaminase-like superfamily